MKKLKNLIVAITLVSSTVIFAQPQGGKKQEMRENIEAQKVAYITQKLNLSPEEAQKFWPIYNQYQDKLHELRKKRKQDVHHSKQNFETLSDSELEQIIDNDLALRQKELDLQKEYNVKFKTALPIKKVAKLYATEEQFKMVLLNKLKEKEKPNEH